MTTYQIYREMFNNIPNIEQQIKEYAIKKNHTIISKTVDVFVQNEEKREYFVDFEAKNAAGNYYRVRNYYTIDEMKKVGIIEK